MATEEEKRKLLIEALDALINDLVWAKEDEKQILKQIRRDVKNYVHSTK